MGRTRSSCFVRSQQVERINSFSFDGEAVLTAGDGVGTGKIFHYIKGKCDIHQRVYRISDFRDDVSGYYFYLFFSTNFYNRIMQMTAKSSVDSVRREMIARMLIALPPKAEQEAIAEALSDADALIESLEALIAKKRAIKQGAMQDLLSGRKRLPGFSGEWVEKKIGELADTDPENLSSATAPDFSFNYIALEDVHEGTLVSYSERVFSSAPSRARRRLQGGDLLFGTVRPNLKTHYQFDTRSGEWVCSTGFCVIRCRQRKAEPSYIFNHLFADRVSKQIDMLISGSNYPAVNSKDVAALTIPCPDYEEQASISQALSEMQEEIAILEAKLAKARQIKQGMMQELLTGRVRLV